MKVANEAAPSDHELLMLASDLARAWVKGTLIVLMDYERAEGTEMSNAQDLLREFGLLEKYVRTNAMPDVDSEKQEQFIRCLEKHWKCEVQNAACPPEITQDNVAQDYLH